MLRITFYAGGIKIEGHAFFAPAGTDIVCAAVSGIVFGGLNWFVRDNVKVDSHPERDTFAFELLSSDPHDLVALNVIQTQITAIAKSYPDNVLIVNSTREIEL